MADTENPVSSQPLERTAPQAAPRDLVTGPILYTLLAFAVPTLASSVLQSINGLINTIGPARPMHMHHGLATAFDLPNVRS